MRMAISNTLLRNLSAIAAVTTGVLLGSPARAADDAPNILSDPFQLSLGTFAFTSDTEIRFDGDTSAGTPVDWENTFGGGDQTRFRVDGHWRFGDSGRHKVRFMWFNSSHSGSKTIEEDIHFGDVTFPVDAKVKADMGFDIYELAYEYAFLRRDTYEIAGTIGLHWTSLSSSLSAKASTSGGNLEGDIKREASVDAPLPVIGVRGLWALPHDFYIDAGAQFFSLSFDKYDGSLQDYRVMAVWQPKKWLGIGLGYNQFNVDVDVDGDKFNGNLNWKYHGPMLSYSAVF
jgi:hypothetical protein